MAADIDSVTLQLAMAFGQGAGVMLADDKALGTLLSHESEVLTQARTNWKANRWAFTELVRILGQLSAAKAAANGSAVIRWEDIAPCVNTVMVLCPCLEPGVLQKLIANTR